MRVAIFTDNDFAKVNGVTTALRALVEHAPAFVQPRIYTCDSHAVEMPTYFSLPARGVGDAAAMQGAIERLIDDEALRRTMSANCRQYAQGCSWETVYSDFWLGNECYRPTPATEAEPVMIGSSN